MYQKMTHAKQSGSSGAQTAKARSCCCLKAQLASRWTGLDLIVLQYKPNHLLEATDQRAACSGTALRPADATFKRTGRDRAGRWLQILLRSLMRSADFWACALATTAPVVAWEAIAVRGVAEDEVP